MFDLLLVPFRIGVGFGDAFCHDLLVTFLVARVPTVFALIAGCVEQKLVAIGTEHDLIELLGHKLVTVHFVNFFSFTEGNLTSKTGIHRSLADVLLDKVEL